MTEIRLNDYGMNIDVIIKGTDDNVVNIGAASQIQLILVPPTDSPSLTVDMSLLTDGTDGAAYYIVQEGDFNIIGTWEVQIHIVFSSAEYHSSIGKIKVLRNIG